MKFILLRIVCMAFALVLVLTSSVGCNESADTPTEAPSEGSTPSTGSNTDDEDLSLTPGEAREFSVTSGKHEVVPKESLLWANKYDKDTDKWVSADYTDVSTVVKTYGKSVPTLYKSKNAEFNYSECLEFYKLQVFTTLGDELELESNSLDEINKLPYGIWTVAVTMVYNGGYVAAHKKQETTGVLYTFNIQVFPTAEEEKTCFCGVIREINGNKSLVEPYKGCFRPGNYSEIEVYLGEEHDFKVGDAITVWYDGMILETDPPRPSGLESVEHYNGKLVAVNGFGYDVDTYRVGSKTWHVDKDGNGGWTFMDGAMCEQPKHMTESEREAVSVIIKSGRIIFALPDSENIITSIKVFDGKTYEAREYPNDLSVVNDLLAGEYFVIIDVSARGEFIEQEASGNREDFASEEDFYKHNTNAFEKTYIQYMFKLIVE